MSTRPAVQSKAASPAWQLWLGGLGLIGLGMYGLIIGNGASPCYPAALVAFGFAGVARALQRQHPLSRQAFGVVTHAPTFFFGVAAGLVVAAWIT